MTTKIHATVDALGNPTRFHLTPGQAHDLEGADILLKGTQAGGIIADKVYDAQARVIEPLLQAGKAVVIPPKASRRHQRSYDRHPYKARHLIENFFARLTSSTAPLPRAMTKPRATSWVPSIWLALSFGSIDNTP